MAKTEEKGSKLKLFGDAPNKVVRDFQPTGVVSEYNMRTDSNTGESSVSPNQEFSHKKQKFLEECLEKNILLEGLLTSVFLEDGSLTDVFESGIAKAANFSELGDIQTVLSAVTQWCMKLHTKFGKKRSQQVTWLQKNGLKETKLKEIDKQLYKCYTEVTPIVPDEKQPVLLHFNNDALLVHENLVEIMAKLWYNRLCIYQGHKDLGYLQISSKVPGLIGRQSCYRLTNEPPRFVLSLDSLNNDHIPTELNLLVCVGEDLAACILSRHHNVTPKDMVDQFFCVPVATNYMSFELGSLASSEVFSERLKSICGHVIKVMYDRDLKQLSVICPKVGCDRVKSALEEGLKSLQAELEREELEIPFPNLHSPLRIKIGGGLECVGITRYQRFCGKELREVHKRKYANNSHSSATAEVFPAYPENANLTDRQRVNNLYNHHQIPAAENAVVYECYTESLIVKQTNILLGDKPVVFDSSVEVILHCIIQDKMTDGKNGNDFVTFKDTKTIVITGIIRMFAYVGLKTDGTENSVAIWEETTSESLHQFELKIVFPNVYAARTGISSLERISSTNFSVCLRHPLKVATDLKTIRVKMTQDFFHIIEKPLQGLLARMQQKNVVKSWIRNESFFSENPSTVNLHALVSVTATENCRMQSLRENLENFLQPTKVTFDNLQLQYLQSNDGAKFLKFLMHFTKTCIHLPDFQQIVYIYGDSSNKTQSASILKKQMEGNATSCGFGWYLFDFEKTCFNSKVLKNCYHKMRSHLDELKHNGDISEYFLFDDRPELWLETKADVFNKYSEEIKSLLLQEVDVTLDKKCLSSPLMCSVCFLESLEISSKDCYLLSVCGHAYCRECLLQLVTQSVKARNLPVKCALDKCDKALSAAELRYICGVVQYCDIRKLLPDVLKSFIGENAASFGFCSRRRCKAICVIYEEKKMKACLWCQGRFCLHCDKKFHGTITCEEVWSMKDWLKEVGCSRKRCPNCHIGIEKVDGCNTVFCGWCKNFFCWNCANFYSKTSDKCYAHVCKPQAYGVRR